jgi:two-component sensor histidine kinase
VALARTHSRLAEAQRQAVSIRDLLCDELEPYDDGAWRRIRLQGPTIDLPADVAVPLAMVIHELTTNAVKHGALSVLGGSVEVIWDLDAEADEIRFDWLERGRPGRGTADQARLRLPTPPAGPDESDRRKADDRFRS